MDKKTLERFLYILSGGLIGSAATFYFSKKALSRHYRDIAEQEIGSVKASYNDLLKSSYRTLDEQLEVAKKHQGEPEDPYKDLLDQNGYFVYSDDEEDMPEELMVVKPPLPDGRPDPETVVHDIHDDRTDPPRYEGEGKPYVITVEEFMSDKEDFAKITVNYYEYDNTMASEDESIIQNHEAFLGGEFQNYIGWKSGSDHTVYVRNENLSSDYEVLVDPGSYEEEVLGILPDEHPKKQMLQMRNNE